MALPKIFHDSRFDDGTPAASTTAAGFDVLNLLDWRPFNKWQPTALPASVTVDCGIAKAADYGLVWGNDLHDHGARAEFRGSTDNFSASDVLLGQVSPPSAGREGLLAEWTSASYRYWRLSLEYINLLTYTEEFDHADWTKNNVSISADATTDSDGALTADKIIESVGLFTHIVSQSGTSFISGRSYTIAIEAKAAERSAVVLTLPVTAFGTEQKTAFDLSAGAVVAGGSGTATITDKGDGWYLCTMTATATATTTGNPGVYLNDALDTTVLYTGDGSSGAYMSRSQVEAAPEASDYFKVEAANSGIPTIGIASIGTALEIPKGLREGFDPRGRKPKGVFNKSVSGMPLGRTVQYEEWAQSLTFPDITWTWIRSTWEPAWTAHLRNTPFVFAWDSTSHADELVLANVEGGFTTPHRIGNLADLRINLVGLLA